MTEFLTSLGTSILGTVVGGAILAGLLSLAWRYWRTVQEERLLRAFLEMSGGQLDAALSARLAADQAKLQDPDPALHRLRRKDHIREFPNDRGYYSITFEGRARARTARPWWEFWR